MRILSHLTHWKIA